jgi:hypothetical protein
MMKTKVQEKVLQVKQSAIAQITVIAMVAYAVIVTFVDALVYAKDEPAISCYKPTYKLPFYMRWWNTTWRAASKWIDETEESIRKQQMSKYALTRYRQALKTAEQKVGHRKPATRRIPLMAMAALALAASSDKHDNNVYFDTDSGTVGIDNRCSACISPHLEDFIFPPGEKSVSIKGFGGSRTTGARQGTLQWRIADDSGTIHTFRIPKSYYVPAAEYRLLSPQHWAQAMHSNRQRSGCDTNGVHTKLYWMDANHKQVA